MRPQLFCPTTTMHLSFPLVWVWRTDHLTEGVLYLMITLVEVSFAIEGNTRNETTKSVFTLLWHRKGWEKAALKQTFGCKLKKPDIYKYNISKIFFFIKYFVNKAKLFLNVHFLKKAKISTDMYQKLEFWEIKPAYSFCASRTIKHGCKQEIHQMLFSKDKLQS